MESATLTRVFVLGAMEHVPLGYRFDDLMNYGYLDLDEPHSHRIQVKRAGEESRTLWPRCEVKAHWQCPVRSEVK